MSAPPRAGEPNPRLESTVLIVDDEPGTVDFLRTVIGQAPRVPRYRVVLDLAVDNLEAGMPVVLVAPFTAERTDPDAWAAARDRLMAASGTPVLVWLRLEPAEVLRRLRERAAPRDAPKLTDEAAYLARLATACTPPVVPHHALDATRPPDVLARAVLDALPA